MARIITIGRGGTGKTSFVSLVAKRFIDIGEQPDLAEEYGIQLIPTQIFIDAHGKEIDRHEGFMPREDIVAKLAEMGVEVGE